MWFDQHPLGSYLIYHDLLCYSYAAVFECHQFAREQGADRVFRQDKPWLKKLDLQPQGLCYWEGELCRWSIQN